MCTGNWFLRTLVSRVAYALLIAGWASSGGAEYAYALGIDVIRRGVAHDALFDVQFQGEQGIAVGDHGVILISEDGGSQWAAVDAVPSELALNSVAVAGGRGIVVGQRGTVLVGSDQYSWQRAESGTTQRLLGVAMRADGMSFAVGAFGTLLRSSDSGETWERLALDWDAFLEEKGYEPHLYDVAIRGDGTITVIGEFGLIISSTDQGATWKRRRLGSASLFGLGFCGEELGYAVGQDGVVLRTRDGGRKWVRIETGAGNNLLGVWCSGTGEVAVVGVRALLQSSDSGDTWRSSENVEVLRRWFQAVTAVDKGLDSRGKADSTKIKLFAVGHSGTVVRIID